MAAIGAIHRLVILIIKALTLLQVSQTFKPLSLRIYKSLE
jgi:hypothetical protein